MNQQKMKLPTSRIQGMYRQWALICFILSTIAASLAFTLAYNPQTGYISNTAIDILLAALVFFELIISATISYSAPMYINEENRTALSRVTTLILHIAVIFCGVMAAAGCNNAIFSIDAIKGVSGSAFLPSYILRGALAASTVAIFLSSPSLRKTTDNYTVASQINSYSTIFFCIFGIAILYFNMTVEMNNPQKLYLQFSLASICLSELYKMKAKIQEKGGNCLSSLFKLSTIFIAPIAAISTFIALAEKGKNFPAAYLYFAIAVAVYAIAYLIEIIFSAKSDDKE